VEVNAEVTSSAPVATLDLFVNGWPAARLREPPWRMMVPVPDQAGACRFTIVARTTDGGRGSDSVEARRVVLEDRMEVALRQVYVSVSGPGLVFNRLLGPQDFTIVDRGKDNPVATLARGDTPISAVLLVDASESMRGRLEAAFAAARTFLAGLAPGDEAAVMVFADRLLALTPFGPPEAGLLEGVERGSAAGGTALNDHLYAALRLLDERPGRRVVLLLSDGADVTSALSAEDVLWKVRHSDAAIYWLRLPGPQGSAGYSSSWRDVTGNAREEQGLLAAIAESGGRSQPLASVAELARAFGGVVSELRQQYVLGFYPQELRRDGTWRPIEVKSGVPGLRLRYRAGWVDR
jgi:Ca-activated chloride channel family protein